MGGPQQQQQKTERKDFEAVREQEIIQALLWVLNTNGNTEVCE
jgi:hypothetical protein